MSALSPRLRRLAGLTAVPALALATLSALPSAPAGAAEPDPAPLAAGSAWLEAQLSDGPFSGPFTEGLSIDAVLALDAVGGDPAIVEATIGGLESRMQGGSGYVVSTEGGTYESGGSAAKAAVMLQRTGGDPTEYGGLDLIDTLESLTSTAPGLAGRVFARFNGDADLSFTNTPVQAFAAEALHAADSELSDEAASYLIRQQCAEGFFREEIPGPDGPQSCDEEETAAPSPDSTALAVLALLQQRDVVGVQKVIDDAVAWLLEAQKSDGSFGASPLIPQANTNSTGLAGWALGEAGKLAAAERAAAWVRAHQADEPAPCTSALKDDQGAIAYDIPALNAGRKNGITDEQQDQWRRATTQALPALQWAPGAGPASNIRLKDFYQAGSRVKLVASGFAPGDYVCFRRGRAGVGLGLVGFNGRASTTVTLPKGTAKRTYLSASGEAEGQPLVLHALDATKLPLDLKRTVAKGGTQVVKIGGLVKGESFSVTFRGKRVDTGTANAKGRAVARFGVGRKTGPVRVLVLGEFKNRRSSRAFTVTR